MPKHQKREGQLVLKESSKDSVAIQMKLASQAKEGTSINFHGKVDPQSPFDCILLWEPTQQCFILQRAQACSLIREVASSPSASSAPSSSAPQTSDSLPKTSAKNPLSRKRTRTSADGSGPAKRTSRKSSSKLLASALPSTSKSTNTSSSPSPSHLPLPTSLPRVQSVPASNDRSPLSLLGQTMGPKSNSFSAISSLGTPSRSSSGSSSSSESDLSDSSDTHSDGDDHSQSRKQQQQQQQRSMSSCEQEERTPSADD